MQVTEVVNIPNYPTCTRRCYFEMDDCGEMWTACTGGLPMTYIPGW